MGRMGCIPILPIIMVTVMESIAERALSRESVNGAVSRLINYCPYKFPKKNIYSLHDFVISYLLITKLVKNHFSWIQTHKFLRYLLHHFMCELCFLQAKWGAQSVDKYYLKRQVFVNISFQTRHLFYVTEVLHRKRQWI